MLWLKKATRRLHRLNTKYYGVRGNVDGVFSDTLVGWAQPLRGNRQELSVGIYVNGAIIVEAPANIYRGDLEAAGVGDGRFGFTIHLSQGIKGLVAANGGIADVRANGAKPVLIGYWDVGDCVVLQREDAALPSNSTSLHKSLYADIQKLASLLDKPASTVSTRPTSSHTHQKLFGRHDYIDPDAQLPAEMFGYTEYIRYRDRLDEKFDTANNADDIAHFFKRYLSAYSAMRGGIRVPLSRAALDYLNTPITFGGIGRGFTRAMWAFVLDTPQVIQSADFKNEDWYGWVVYWWAQVQARAIHCEDCLVPEFLVDVLRMVPKNLDYKDWPVSDYMRRIAMENPALAALNIDTTDGRQDLSCALLVRAISYPETLRYLPPSVFSAAFTKTGGTSVLGRFCAQFNPSFEGLTRAQYAAVLRHRHFDLDAMQSLFFTAEGHRVEYAGLPAIDQTQETVDVQVIGPFKKASGLGQATRLSAQMLERAGLSVNKVDFGLDNPAPEGFSRVETMADYRPAKVNLIHLNAEAIPLTYAYQPDVFTNAYNIGYFFWELDSPGACHFLGMDMLDEIWVSTQFGVDVFKPHTDVPVTNVGMSFEVLPQIDKAEARRFLKKIVGTDADDFVFLVTFDSFSFVQRKNPLSVLTAFALAFPKDDPAAARARLVIKTQNRTKIADPEQIRTWTAVDAMLAQDPRIVLINKTLSYEDLLHLKKGVDVYLSLHRAEGWGFGMIEAMNLHVPVICTAYSGNVDFCADGTFWPVDYTLKPLAPNDYIFVRPGQKWAEPDVQDAAQQMRKVFDDPEAAKARSNAAWNNVQTAFGENTISERYGQRMRDILAGLDDAQKGGS